jgi:hypothetical protein
MRKFARARLYFVEQSHVFDRDHRLIGEGLQQLNLTVGEWPHRVSSQSNNAIAKLMPFQGREWT